MVEVEGLQQKISVCLYSAFSNLLESGYHAGVHFQTDSLGTNSPIHELFDLHRTAVITWGSCGFWVVQHMREC